MLTALGFVGLGASATAVGGSSVVSAREALTGRAGGLVETDDAIRQGGAGAPAEFRVAGCW